MCVHRSSYPAAGSPAVGSSAPRDVAAHVVAAHPEQGWNLLCDGTIIFDDTGELRPDGGVVAPHRVPAGGLAMAA